MADTIGRTFDLYNTTFYWKGYSMSGFETQVGVAQAYYTAQYSSNPIGSQIDFFTELTGVSSNNPGFSLSGTTLTTLLYLWGKYWWEEAVFYSNSIVLNEIRTSAPTYYQPFSESVGSLYYISYANNNNNTNTVPYNTLIDRLLIPGISSAIQQFYTVANKLFIANIVNIGPTGTDTSPNNGNLIMADTDLARMVQSKDIITNNINSAYPFLSTLLPFNNVIVGNLITPYNWTTKIQYEDTAKIGDTTITVDQNNDTISTQTQLTLDTLMV